MVGQIVYEESINKFSGKYQKAINIGKHAKGVYTLQLINDEGTVNRKIVVE